MATTPPNRVYASSTAGAAGTPNTGLVDAEVAADFLGVPASWVRAEARAGRIPHRLLGRYRRFSLPELEAWADDLAVGPTVYRKYKPMGSGL